MWEGGKGNECSKVSLSPACNLGMLASERGQIFISVLLSPPAQTMQLIGWFSRCMSRPKRAVVVAFLS